MHYTVYKITNLINNKIYIGCHKTKNIDDGYMGSGLLIKRAISKYGIENFRKEILSNFESQDQMFEEEKLLISKNSPEYNLHPGGNGGFEYINKNNLNSIKNLLLGTEAVKQKLKTNIAFVQSYSDQRSNGLKKYYETHAGNCGFKNKTHSKDTIAKMSESQKGKHDGNKNSQFGTYWITNGIENKKNNKLDIIPEGWYKGRKLKQPESIYNECNANQGSLMECRLA